MACFLGSPLKTMDQKCYGPSMEPTLKTRDVLLTDHVSPRLKKIEVGDVVVAKSPADYRYVCKRVVAGPGDIVLFKNNTFTVNTYKNTYILGQILFLCLDA